MRRRAEPGRPPCLATVVRLGAPGLARPADPSTCCSSSGSCSAGPALLTTPTEAAWYRGAWLNPVTDRVLAARARTRRRYWRLVRHALFGPRGTRGCAYISPPGPSRSAETVEGPNCLSETPVRQGLARLGARPDGSLPSEVLHPMAIRPPPARLPPFRETVPCRRDDGRCLPARQVTVDSRLGTLPGGRPRGPTSGMSGQLLFSSRPGRERRPTCGVRCSFVDGGFRAAPFPWTAAHVPAELAVVRGRGARAARRESPHIAHYPLGPAGVSDPTSAPRCAPPGTPSEPALLDHTTDSGVRQIYADDCSVCAGQAAAAPASHTVRRLTRPPPWPSASGAHVLDGADRCTGAPGVTSFARSTHVNGRRVPSTRRLQLLRAGGRSPCPPIRLRYADAPRSVA